MKVRQAERALQRLEHVEKPFEPWQLQLALAPRRRGAQVVARLERAVLEQGSFGLGPFDLEIGRGERVSLAGPNGSGKSTIVEALLGRLPLSAGRRAIGPGVVPGELAQARLAFADSEPLLPAFVSASRLASEDARTLLAKFGLGAEHVLRPGASLSPGERTRASLALLMATGVNWLVLDEPTNHLDLPAIEELERALEAYEGTLVLVTHDRRLLERVRITRVVDVAALPVSEKHLRRRA
jgi:ATPase subunit of ABC transporter with duplicated ATPase domains